MKTKLLSKFTLDLVSNFRFANDYPNRQIVNTESFITCMDGSCYGNCVGSCSGDASGG